MRISWIRSN